MLEGEKLEARILLPLHAADWLAEVDAQEERLALEGRRGNRPRQRRPLTVLNAEGGSERTRGRSDGDVLVFRQDVELGAHRRAPAACEAHLRPQTPLACP